MSLFLVRGIAKMALKQAVRDKIMDEVIHAVKGQDWKILVLDALSTRMISSCCKMTTIMSEGITLVEDLSKSREPLPTMEAVYLITPSEESIKILTKDFSEYPTRYKLAHVFFTEACPDELFSKLCKSTAARHIKTLKEINVAFLPHESQVFSLDCPDAFGIFYGHDSNPELRSAKLERFAEQIATLCATLGEYPAVRYRSAFSKNSEFANLVQQKLNAYRAEDPTMGQGPFKDRSQLLILDRGFDPISPLLHELTYQAMAYDLLQIKNDVYSYVNKGKDEGMKEALLDENDEIWRDLRHRHIAEVSAEVPKRIREFGDKTKMGTADKSSMRDLSQMIKKMPQYQKELSKYSVHLRLAEDCMRQFSDYVSKVCEVEQNLAMGANADGEKIKLDVKLIMHFLQDASLSVSNKIRLIIIYILQNGGLSEENLRKLVQYAQIPEEETASIRNLAILGVPIIQEGGKIQAQQAPYLQQPTDDHLQPKYQLSRWTPYIKTIMEENEKLSTKLFPYLSEAPRAATMSGGAAPVSARYQWHEKRGQATTRTGPRFIIFVMGGVALSEMRSAYEVTQAAKNWEIIIGSTHILTPEVYLQDLKSLKQVSSIDSHA